MMKTPHAILIGLSLIAAAIFFKDTATNFNFVKDAHAFDDGKKAYFKCYFNRMDDARTQLSAMRLSEYCRTHR